MAAESVGGTLGLYWADRKGNEDKGPDQGLYLANNRLALLGGGKDIELFEHHLPSVKNVRDALRLLFGNKKAREMLCLQLPETFAQPARVLSTGRMCCYRVRDKVLELVSDDHTLWGVRYRHEYPDLDWLESSVELGQYGTDKEMREIIDVLRKAVAHRAIYSVTVSNGRWDLHERLAALKDILNRRSEELFSYVRTCQDEVLLSLRNPAKSLPDQFLEGKPVDLRPGDRLIMGTPALARDYFFRSDLM